MNSIYVAGQRKGRKYRSDLEKRRGKIWTTPAPVSTVFTPTIRTPLLQWWQMVRNALVCLFFRYLCLFLPLFASSCLTLPLFVSFFISLCLTLSLSVSPHQRTKTPIVTMMLNGRNTLSLFLYLYLSWSLNLCLCHSLTLLSFSMVVLIYD